MRSLFKIKLPFSSTKTGVAETAKQIQKKIS